MRKQTDLAEVKLTALALLSTEIYETQYSPVIVKHPFTDTGVSTIPDGNGGVTMILCRLRKIPIMILLFFISNAIYDVCCQNAKHHNDKSYRS